MANWSDLPAELRILIFHYIFEGRTFSHHFEEKPYPRSDHQLPNLLLVSKTFAEKKDILTAMFSEITFRMHSSVQLFSVSQNPQVGPLAFAHLRRLQFYDVIDCVALIPLKEFEYALPLLETIDLLIATFWASELSCGLSEASTLLPWLVKAAKNEHCRGWSDMGIIRDMPEPSQTQVEQAQAGFNLDREYREGTVDSHEFQTAIFRFLQGMDDKIYWTERELEQLWWIVLVDDAVCQHSKIEVTITTYMYLEVRDADDKFVDYLCDVPMVFSTKDKNMRILIDDFELVVPQASFRCLRTRFGYFNQYAPCQRHHLGIR